MQSIIEFFRKLFGTSASASAIAAATAQNAVAQLHNDDDDIAAALRAVERAKEARKTHAAASAVALKDALAAAATEAAEAEVERQAELDEQNDETNATIKALEESIAAARRVNEEKLGELAVKHSGERAAEQADQKTATDALALVLGAAGKAPSAK